MSLGRDMKIAAILFLASALNLQVPLLDLTDPPDLPPTDSLGSPSLTSSPLQLAILRVNDQPYVIGDDFEYELEIRNLSQGPIAIPWSRLPVGPDSSRIRATIAIVLSSTGGPDKFMAGRFFFGSRDLPNSMITLGPNEAVRVRSIGRWDVPGEQSLVQELSRTDGRYHIRARLLIDDGVAAASTGLSPPQAITLALRQ